MSPDLSLWIKNNLQIQENYNIQILILFSYVVGFVFLTAHYIVIVVQRKRLEILLNWLPPRLSVFVWADIPGGPGNPLLPLFPGDPGRPFAPFFPLFPAGPGGPWGPADPGKPGGPGGPFGPTRPDYEIKTRD